MRNIHYENLLGLKKLVADLRSLIKAISKSYVFVNTRIWCRSSSQLKGYEIVHTILLLQVQRMLLMEIYKILNILKSYYLNNKYLLNCWEFIYTFSIESFEYQIGSKSDPEETYFNRYGTFKKFDIIWFLKLVQVIQALCIWFTFFAARNIINFNERWEIWSFMQGLFSENSSNGFHIKWPSERNLCTSTLHTFISWPLPLSSLH